MVGFHAQQAVEKALKAALAAERIEFPFTHDLDGLMDLCRSATLDLPEALDGAEALSPFGVTFRYGVLEPIGLDRRQALAWAETAVEWAAGVIRS